ncbi:Zn-ribbon containing protein [Halobacteriaceae archaeon GCM10025711]
MPHECTNCGRTFPDGSKEMLSGCPDCGGNKFQFDPSEPASAPSSGGTADATAAAAELRRDDRTESDGNRPPDGTDGTAGRRGRATGGVDRIDTGDVDRIDTEGGTSTDTGGDEPDDGSYEWPEVGTREGLEAQRAARAARRGEPTEWPDHFDGPNDRDADAAESEDVEVTHSTEPRPSTPDPEDVEVTHASEAASDAEATGTTGKVDVVDDAADFSDDRDEEDSAQASARRDVVSLGELTGSPGMEHDDPEEPEPRERPDIAALREELNQQFESIRIVDRGTYELNLMSLYDREEYIIQLQEDGKYVIEVPDAWDHGPDE